MAEKKNNGLHGENASTFEESFRRLQEVVQRLSEGNLTLGEALAAYEEGMSLAERCATMLDEAELRVKSVSERAMRAGSVSAAELVAGMRDQPDGEPELVSFEVESYEALVFDTVPGKKRGKTGNVPPPDGEADKPGTPDKIPFEELDPLFDEDE
jgi:exodeoxyribonuclease VII small subunit